MHKKTVLVIICACFYLTMFVLALCSRKLYEAKLPKVCISYLEQKAFWEDGEYSYFPALPESMHDRPLYYVAVGEKIKKSAML